MIKAQEGAKEISAKLDRLPDILKEDGCHDVQAFMRTFREMESVVEQYNRDIAKWERQISRNHRKNSVKNPLTEIADRH